MMKLLNKFNMNNCRFQMMRQLNRLIMCYIQIMMIKIFQQLNIYIRLINLKEYLVKVIKLKDQFNQLHLQLNLEK